MHTTAPDLVDWRRQVHELYAVARDGRDQEAARARWRKGRDRLFREHSQSPLASDDPLRETGLPYWPYDPTLRWELPLQPPASPEDRVVNAGDDGELTMQLIGTVALPKPVGGTLGVWWLRQYGGGIFIPLRDGTSDHETYGGGRYLLDTAKGAWLGGTNDLMVIDLNFLYHPSCRYNPRWQCPLAPTGNTISARVEAGERLAPPGQ